MAQFMAIYTGVPGSQRPDEATIAKGMAAWQGWMQTHAADIVGAGGPLGKTKRVNKDGVAEAEARTTEAFFDLFHTIPRPI